MPMVTSRARTTRRRLVGSMRAAATGSSAARRRWSAAVSGSASSSARTAGIAGRDLQAVDRGPQVEAGSAHQHGPPAARGDVGQRGGQVVLEPRDRVVLVGVDHVDEVVADLGLLGGDGLAVPMSMPR